MYTIWVRDTTDSNAQDICIYNDESTFEEYKLASASLSLQEGSAGSLSLKVPPTNAGYLQFKILTTQVTVRKNGAVYWMGRLLTPSEDFYKNLNLTCEGYYNYLMDTVIPQQHMVGRAKAWVEFLLSWHNRDHYASGEYWKIIQPGVIELNDGGLNNDFYSDFETIMDLVNNACEGWGGHPFLRYEPCTSVTYDMRDGQGPVTVTYGGKTYYNLVLDIKTSYDNSGNIPTIKFGENLEDYTKECDVEELATVLLPKGGTYTDQQTADILEAWDQGDQKEYARPIEGLDYHCTVYDANDGDIYVLADSDKLAQYGVVHKVVEFDTCTDPEELLDLANDYLENQKWVATTITIEALDAKLLGADVDEITIGRGVYCFSAPHNLNQIYPCTAINENLLDPSSTKFTLGVKKDTYLSDATRKADDKLRDLIIENRRKENIIKGNTDRSIRLSFQDPTIWTNSELMEAVDAKVRAGVSTAESVATGDAKANMLQLLNIYDQDKNRYNKGYVHFKRINMDYGGNRITINEVKQRLLTAFPSQATYINDYFTNYIENYWNNPDYFICMALGSLANQIAITIWASESSYRKNSQGDLFLRDVGQSSKIFGGENRYGAPSKKYKHLWAYGGSFLTDSSGQGTNGSWANWIAHNPLQSNSSFGNYWDYYILPSEVNVNSTQFTFYCNRNIYASQSSDQMVYPASFLDSPTPVSDAADHIYEICISDELDYTSPTASIWRWNKTGLYFIEGGYTDATIPNPEETGYQNQTGTLRIGITADGNIVADRICVGKLDAGIIRAGYLTSQDYLVEHGGSGNIQDAHFLLDINNGIMTAKTGTLIFNKTDELDGRRGMEKSGCSNFAYLSNLTTGEFADSLGETGKGWMYVSGEKSRDWMMIIGSNFGVDKYGRVFMREGIIGATGGYWDLKFFNDDYVNIQWVQKDENTAEMQYKVSINTTAARPLGAQVADTDIYNSGKEQLVCRWRLAKYDSNHNLVFYSPLYNLSPPAGNNSYEYAWSNFASPITYQGTKEAAREYYADTYYAGVFFPVYYIMQDASADPDYTQDGHSFNVISGATIEISGGTATKPEYTSYSDGRYVPNILSNYDSVNIGSGYLYCGTIGNNSSFSLSAINRTARLSVPDGRGNNFTERNDWRLTIGSKLGVTDDGTLHCYGAYLRSAVVDSTLTASYVDTDNVGGVLLNAKQAEDGTQYTFNLHISMSANGAQDTTPIRIWVTGGETYDNSTSRDTNHMVPVNDSISQSEFYGNIQLKIDVASHFTGPGGVGSDQFFVLENYTCTYRKDTPTTINGSVNQKFYLGDSTSWTTPRLSGYTWDSYTVSVTMTNERSGNDRPTWVFNGWTQGAVDSSVPYVSRHLYFNGDFSVSKQVADHFRDVVNVANRDIIAGNSSKWLGGPSRYWGHGYISHIHYTDMDQSSSRIYKNDIRSLTDIYDRVFDDLNPVSYMYKNDERNVRHMGFIMEEVGNTLTKVGMTPSDFGAYNPNIKGVGGSLNYIDFIALNTRQIQKLKERIRELEERLDEVERNENSSNT